IKATLKIPVIANGEIWTIEDYLRCREQSQCDDVMLGRGLLSCPDLARQIKAHVAGEIYEPLRWPEICQMLFDYYRKTTPLYDERNCGNRVKQWLMYLSRQYPQAQIFFDDVKRKSQPNDIEDCFNKALYECSDQK
ncbi:MAG: tRNA-dihydrouridine synthase, partial [Sphingobacteriales bacterium]